MGGLHERIIYPDDFTPEEVAAYSSFKPLPLRVQPRVQEWNGKGLIPTLYTQSNLHQPNDQGLFSDLLKRRDAPDTSNWPR